MISILILDICLLLNTKYSFFMFSRRFIIFSIIFILLVGGTVAALAHFTTPVTLSHSVVFEVAPGDSVWKIAQALFEQKIIRSPLWFVLQASFTGNFGSLKPGVYEISSMSLRELIHTLSLGPQEVRVTIVPGMTLREIDTLLTERGILSVGSLRAVYPSIFREVCSVCSYAQSLEGLLDPDTYQFYRGSTAQTVVKTILENSEKKLSLARGDKKYTDHELYEKIIIASLLEKEVPGYSDKQLVAGIIYKRLTLSMPLQIDASVLYGACVTAGGDCTVPRDIFKIDGPFNTYLRKGLPPTPIAAPSLDSLRAAFTPHASSYLYYLTDPATGTTHFSKTFDEHDAKRGVYIMR